MKSFEMGGEVSIGFSDLLINSCQNGKWEYVMSVHLKVLEVSMIKSKTEIFNSGNKGNSVSYVMKIEGSSL